MRARQRNQYLRAMGFTPLSLREAPQAPSGDPVLETDSVTPEPERPEVTPATRVDATSVEALGGSPVLASASVRILQDASDPLATVLVVWSEGELELDPLHPGGGLLIKMLAALKVPLERFRIVALAPDHRSRDWVDYCANGRPLFCLADRALDVAGQRIVMLPSLERMLREQAPAKREAWASLQPWLGLGGSRPSGH